MIAKSREFARNHDFQVMVKQLENLIETSPKFKSELMESELVEKEL